MKSISISATAFTVSSFSSRPDTPHDRLENPLILFSLGVPNNVGEVGGEHFATKRPVHIDLTLVLIVRSKRLDIEGDRDSLGHPCNSRQVQCAPRHGRRVGGGLVQMRPSI